MLPGVVSRARRSIAQPRSPNINYDLTFDIPADVDAPIAGVAAITFDLSNAVESMLQLDFREDPAGIERVEVNGEGSGWTFSNEHIVIPADELERRTKQESILNSSPVRRRLNRNPEYLIHLFVPDRARTAFPLIRPA